MSGRYNKLVKIGNWCEEMMCDEEDIKDIMLKMDRKELLIQKSGGLKQRTLERRYTSTVTDGYLHYGDKVMFICKGDEPPPRRPSFVMIPRPDLAMAINCRDPGQVYTCNEVPSPSEVTASPYLNPIMRNIFVFDSCDDSKVGDFVPYGKPCLIRTDLDAEGLYLQSDRKDLMNFSKMALHQEVALVKEPTFLAGWEILVRDPRLRNEYAGAPVRVNEPVVIRHSKTHNNLNVEEAHPMSTVFGREWEISCHRMYDSHKYELSTNHWVIRMFRDTEKDELKY